MFVPVDEYIAPAPALLIVVEHISAAPAGYAAPVLVVKYVAPAVLVPVVENIHTKNLSRSHGV